MLWCGPQTPWLCVCPVRELLRGAANPLLMGIFNATPDSFSDGGRYPATSDAMNRIRDLVASGADLIDIGGESTRPGAKPVPEALQMQRTLDIIAGCRAAHESVAISIDTTRSRVAEQALHCGATWINDVTAGTDDPDMLGLAAEHEVPICLMHMQGRPATMQQAPHYENVVEEVYRYLLQRAEAAVAAGVREDCIVLDPGIGFGKTYLHNLQLLASLPRFVATGFPVLLGTSRKGFLAPYTRTGPDPADRVIPTCATTAWGTASGVRIFRVHDLPENREAADTIWAIKTMTQPPYHKASGTQ